MSYTREDALKLNDEKITIEKVSLISDFEFLLAQKVNKKLGLPEKFGYSEKAIKFEKLLHLKFDVTE
jgi:hypothetical protein